MSIHGDFSVWLIEYTGTVPVPVYVPAFHGGWLTCNPWAAKRFSTQKEAQDFMTEKNITEPWKAIEHGFAG